MNDAALLLASPTWVNVVIGVLSAAIASLAVILTTPLQYVLNRRSLEHKLKTEYEYEQRKELRDLIGRYHGRVVEAADAWRNRMNNLYDHEAELRMAVDGKYVEPDYYFGTSVYRFMTLATLARQFEAEAFYIDARIAETSDLYFLKYAKALRWVMADLELVKGIPYDAWEARDHFLNDRYRGFCDAFAPNGNLPSLAEFEARAGREPLLEPVFRFFDGLCADEDRLRWDRLVAHHLLVMAFLNLAGYDIQRSDDERISRAVGRFKHPQIAANFVRVIEHLGLGEEENAQRVRAAVRARPEVQALLSRSAEDEPATSKLLAADA